MDLSKSKTEQGFTLVEALVALALLTVGLVPAFVQASSALALSSSIRNTLIASALAQEGAEVVRTMRDANWIAGASFEQGLDGCASGCRVQYDSATPEPLAGNPKLDYDPASGRYLYGGPEESVFSRSVTVESVSDHELAVTVRVEWTDRRGEDKSFEVEYHLYDWLQFP